MPAIIVNDYTWRQSPEFVVISTRVIGHPKKIDLFVIDNYLKASYAPFILELFLWGTIDDEASECTIGDETAVFTLRKKEIGVEWPCLLMEDLDKDKKRAQRSRALEIARVSAEKRAKARSEKRHELQRQAVRAQIDLTTQSINKIDAIRDSHRKEAMRDFEDWRNNAAKPILDDVTGILQENRKAYKAPYKWLKTNEDIPIVEEKINSLEISSSEFKTVEESKEDEKDNGKENPVGNNTDSSISENANTKDEPTRLLSARKNRDSAHIVATSSSSSDSSSSEDNFVDSKDSRNQDEKVRRKFYQRKKRGSADRGKEIVKRLLASDKSGFLRQRTSDRIFEENGVAMPRPRRSVTIDVNFTERKFLTPARESSHLEEQEWLEKQAEARRKCGFVSEDLRPEEQDPQWLKEKGDDFFKAGNYLGAISAYTHGIKLSDKMSSLYVNRSAAHYASENYRRCAEDCSKALELMEPKCEGNRDSRARCHARMGAALCKLSAPQHGIPELEAALKLAPENETIKRDLQVAKRYFEMKD